MLLLVGLGNPGPRHARNRHNIGFMALDEILRRYDFARPRKRFHGLFAEGRVAGERVLALKPLTYMNRSGRSVRAALRFYKLPLDKVVVFHDDLDLQPGKLKVKTGGGNAGHNGLRDIDPQIGRGYRRVRLGIGHPGDKHRVLSYVLKDFAKAERERQERLIEAVAEAAPLLIEGDDPGFMTRVALILNPPKPKPPRQHPPPDDGERPKGDGERPSE